jgi:hypothetical protein
LKKKKKKAVKSEVKGGGEGLYCCCCCSHTISSRRPKKRKKGEKDEVLHTHTHGNLPPIPFNDYQQITIRRECVIPWDLPYFPGQKKKKKCRERERERESNEFLWFTREN